MMSANRTRKTKLDEAFRAANLPAKIEKSTKARCMGGASRTCRCRTASPSTTRRAPSAHGMNWSPSTSGRTSRARVRHFQTNMQSNEHAMHRRMRKQMSEAFICDFVRTPIGRFEGGLSRVRPDESRGGCDQTPGRSTQAPSAKLSMKLSWVVPIKPEKTIAMSLAWRCSSPGCRRGCPA